VSRFIPRGIVPRVGTGSCSKSPADGLVFVVERLFDSEERKKAEDIEWRFGHDTTCEI